MGEIRGGWVGGGADCLREWWWNAAVVFGAFVAMEISREAIRNVQTMFEQCMHNWLKSSTVRFWLFWRAGMRNRCFILEGRVRNSKSDREVSAGRLNFRHLLWLLCIKVLQYFKQVPYFLQFQILQLSSYSSVPRCFSVDKYRFSSLNVRPPAFVSPALILCSQSGWMSFSFFFPSFSGL